MSEADCPRKSWSAAMSAALRPSLFQEEVPVADAVRVSNEGRRGHLGNGPRNLQQLQASFLRQAIAFLRIHLLAGPYTILPRVASTAGTRHNVIDAAFVGTKQLAGVLAAVAIPFANRAGAELRALLRNLRKIRQHNHRRQTNLSAHGMHNAILWPDRQTYPFLPRHGTDLVFTLNLQRGRHARGHLTKGLRRRAHIDRLPIAVQDKYCCFVEHKSFWCLFFVEWSPGKVLPLRLLFVRQP